MSDPDDAQQWHEMAQHLVQAHGGDADKLIGWTATLEQLRFAHADTHVALASINARPPDGHAHPLPMDPGWRAARESSYRPVPPSPAAREDIPFSDPTWPGIFAFPSVWHTGLPHTSVHPRGEIDLADWAAGRFTQPEGRLVGVTPFGAQKLGNIKAQAARASAAWLRGTSFPGYPKTRGPVSLARRGANRTGQHVSQPDPGRGR
jgi:hypothetical protein